MLRRLIADRSGAITVMAAGALTATMAALAFAVDLGSIYFQTRRLQGMADAAALAAVDNLAQSRSAATTAVEAAGWQGPVALELQAGRYRADPAIPAAGRFTVGGAAPDAAKVTLSADAQVYFGVLALGGRIPRIARSATAARVDMASFSIGSRLAALNGGIANALLSSLTGSQIRLSAMDYDALLSADVDLFAFSEALQTELDLQAGSFDRALAASIRPAAAMAALATGLDAGGNGSAANVVRRIAGSTSGASITLDKLIDLGPIGAQDRAAPGQSITVNAFDLLRGMLQLSNGSRQAQLDLGASVPGLLGTTVKMSVGDHMADSPWLTVTDRGEPVIRTAQTRLYIESTIAPVGNVLGIASIRLPLYIELAEAEAKLSSVSCAGGRDRRQATLLVRPGIGHVSIADLNPTDISDHRATIGEGPAKILATPLINVTGQARVDLTAPGWQSVAFSNADIASRATRTVSSNSLVQGVVLSLVQRIALQVNVLGLGLGAPAVTALIGDTLTPAAPALDGVVNALTGLLGIHLGQADVRINGVRCGIPALVA